MLASVERFVVATAIAWLLHMLYAAIVLTTGALPATADVLISIDKSMQRMSELALGARFPARLIKSLIRAKDDAYVEAVGIHWATEQVRDLIDNGVKGVHFYTLNRSKATIRIYETLGLKNVAAPGS